MKRLTVALSVGLSAVLLCVVPARAKSIDEVFKSAPSQILPLLDNTARLDMLDYYNSGMSNSTDNNLGGGSAITGRGAERMDLKITDASTMELALLPAQNDSLIVVISTVMTPVADSKISVFSSDWKQNLTGKVIRVPELDDWLTPAGKKHKADVMQIVPFMLVEYDYNPETQILTFTNNTHHFVGDEIYQIVEGYLYPKMVYKWSGKNFVKQK